MPFTAQARRKRTIQIQTSRSEHMFAVAGAILVHKRGVVLHRRGGCANSWTCIVPAVENAPPRESSTTDGNLTVLTNKVRQPQHGIATFVNARARFGHERLWQTIWTPFGDGECAERLNHRLDPDLRTEIEKKTIPRTIFFSICVHRRGGSTLFHQIYRRA